MKKIILITFIITSYICMGQVGIGTTNPNSSALLDIDVSTITPKKGFLFPRVNLTSNEDISTIPTPATGLMVYNSIASGSGNTFIKANSVVVRNINNWESISNLPEIKTLKSPIEYVLSSKIQQNFNAVELQNINLSMPVVVSWQTGDIYIDNANDISLTGNSIRFLKDSYYRLTGAVNFRANVNVSGSPSQIIMTLQSSTDGTVWNSIFSNTVPIEVNAADKTRTIVFPNFVHHFSSNELLRVIVYKPSSASSYSTNSGIIVNVPGTDITKSLRIIRIQQ